MSKHTPGPWYADGLRFVRQVEAPCHVICRLPHTSGQRDQALIAAAPELLDALAALLHSLDEEDLLHDDQRQAFNAARAAIAKATGEPA